MGEVVLELPQNSISSYKKTPLLLSGQGIMVNEVDEGQPCLICGDQCPGFLAHEWRCICRNCKCMRIDHDIYNNGFVNVRDRIGWNLPSNPNRRISRDQTLCLGYSWVPPGLSEDKVEEYMDQLENNQVPKIGSLGAKYRDHQLIVQLPLQDLSFDYTNSLGSSAEKKNFLSFLEFRDESSMDIGYVQDCISQDMVCRKCDGEIEMGDMAVFAPKADNNACWHPACFMCNTCDELLVDLVYAQKDGELYCERHFAELFRPRCRACDELIFSGEYTKAMEEDWHTSHFACIECDKSLTGHRYILKEEKPYCIVCYEKLFANTCNECSEIIKTDSRDLSHKDKHWHERCFVCMECQTPLVDKPFIMKEDKIYCAECNDLKFAEKCDICSEIFKSGHKKYEYKGRKYYEFCFCCVECKEPVGTKRFMPIENDVICIPCYEEHHAQRCQKCEGIINAGGVTYRGDAWHRDCFTCTSCTTILAGKRFTSKDDRPYCPDCYGETFARKCCRCDRPIISIGPATKFISFDDRNWHSDCFSCYRCGQTLVQKGFLTDGTDIICPTCGRA
uniref:Limpet n=1 Tax=Terebratalia transversa TaxID=34513 RepID=A0A0D4RCA6_TERTR|nr:limpet [Terebratalia transversa]